MLVAEKNKSEEQSVEEVIREAQERRLFQKLQARERLRALLPVDAVELSQEARELVRLKRDYLPQWAAVGWGSAVGKGLPGEAPMVGFMRPTASWELEQRGWEEADAWACNLIESAINEITVRLPLARAALTVRYLNSNGPSVYRSGRLTQLSQAEIEDLCDAAERLLVPVVKRKGLPLW